MQTAMEWIRSNPNALTIHIPFSVTDIVDEAKKESRAQAFDDAQADAIKAFAPELKKLRLDIALLNFIVQCRQSQIKELENQLACTQLLNDFFRGQVEDTAKKVTEAKAIIRDLVRPCHTFKTFKSWQEDHRKAVQFSEAA